MTLSANGMKIENLRLVDFGDCYNFEDDLIPSYCNDPEYVPIENLKYILKFANAKNATLKKLASDDIKRKSKPWSHDVYSLGMTVLEILLCVPLWMHINQRVRMYDGNREMKIKLLGAVFPSIIRKLDTIIF